MRTRSRSLTGSALALLLLPAVALAQQATVSPVSGAVEIKETDAGAYHALTTGGSYPGTAVVRTGADGFALIRYADGSEVVVRPGSQVVVGGEGGEGVLVRLGKVLLRIQRLLVPGQERTHRTPTTVAAIRGTEFGLAVEASGRTRVFVFEGLVAVTNPDVAGAATEVGPGRMTVVAPGRRPTEPRAFSAGEFEGAAAGEVERGEDRAVESGQAPVALRWLAFADPELDALANPAYLPAGAGAGVSAVAFGALAGGGAYVERDGRRTPLVRDAVRRGVGQALGRVTSGSFTWAAFAQGDAGLDRAERAVRPPGSPLSSFFQEETRWTVAEGRVLGAWSGGATSWGVGIGHRQATLDAESSPADDLDAVGVSSTRSDITTVSLGVRRLGVRSTGLSVHHSEIRSTTEADQDAEQSTSLTAVEGLVRGRRGEADLAGWLRLERTAGVEDRTAPGEGLVYREDVDVRTARVGFGVGLTPRSGVLLSLDLAAGMADESAVQVSGAGVVLEDEEDLRLSASVHLGTQVEVAGPWRAELSVLHAVEHIDRDFVIGRDAGGVLLDVRSVYGTRATAGVVYAGARWTGRYAVSASPEAGRPWVHSFLLAVSPG